MFPSKRALNLVAGALGLAALVRFVIVPLYRLLHLGVREHGSFTEDLDFYYSIVAVSLVRFGGALGIAFCIAGMACALGTALGFSVEPARRKWARLWFWYVPIFWFFLEVVGRYQVQLWYANHGILFPGLSFVRESAPRLWWLLATGILTAPAVLTGQGIYRLFSPAPKPPNLPPL